MKIIACIIIILLNIYFIVILKLGVNGLLLSSIISNFLMSIFLFWRLKVYKYISKKNYDLKLMKEMVFYSLPLVPNSISWAIINLSDRIVIMLILGSSMNGIYSIANKFPTIIGTIYGFFYIAWKEAASKIIKTNDRYSTYNSVYSVINNFLFSITICLISVMPFLFPILINKNYSDAYMYIPILTIAMYYSNLSGYYGGIFAAYKNTKIMGKTTIISAIVNLAINLMLISFIGVYAAAISTLVSCIFVYLYRKIKITNYVKITDDKPVYIYILVLTALLISYYFNMFYINILTLLLTIIYSLYLNKVLISNGFKQIKQFLK
jgi:O-antigen/teichoic acid export membrane protein